jgi:16S rRNA (guanine527-N7)-methyltransferase
LIGAAPDPAQARLEQGALELGLALPGETLARALAYLDLLQKWNRSFNLTAVREREAMVTHHLLDSLAIAPYVAGPRVLDLGAGAGLPGIPLALVLPELQFVLLDSNRKKTRFLVQAVAELGLANVEVVAARAEDYRPGTAFDTITARALAEIPQMITWSAPLLRAGGRYLFMKGVFPREELASLPAGFRLEEVVRLRVPGLSAQRHLAIIRPADGGAD